MDGFPATHRHRIMVCAVAALAVLGAASSCSAGDGGSTAGTSPTATASATGQVAAQINQFRDNYSKQIIEIQLTNTTGSALTVLGADLTTPLFGAPITWPARGGGIELPAGQTKSLAAQLPAPECGSPRQSAPPTEPGVDQGRAVVSVRVAVPGATVPGTGIATTAPAADPFGVLARNNAEMCLARAASAVAAIGLAPELEVGADGRTAVVRLMITPRAAPGADAGQTDAGGGTAHELVIDRVQETTLLAEAPAAPWPRALTVRAGGSPTELRMGIRAARCDPHAVAEDKVGTLLPLYISVAGRSGVVKVGAGDMLRGRIYDFVTTACARQ
ncbi:hypothetical protein [Arthrobacter sp. NPDC058192]|uniref:hypothetical protein n=1 Tax=Arthrobacter sp. NPDC058192 TaxID=3346372 RepID=UPI0036EB3FBB